MEERRDLPLDAPEADAAEQKRDWKDEGPDKDTSGIPPGTPEADYLDQTRDAELDEEERNRD
jgi:hypothetical protein